jgi:hypothetical protein
MIEPRIILPDIVAEKSTCRITGALVDEAGVALGSAQLSTLTLTLYALTDGLPIVNANTDKNVLNVNQGTIDAGGLFVLTLVPADNVILATGQTDETHRALLKWTWAAGAKSGLLEIDFRVRNLEKVT